MYSCLIVDDEKQSRENLIYLLKKYCTAFTTFYEADSVASAHDIIVKNQCDLIFLDIEMPYQNGFDLLTLMKSKNIKINCIFVTAFDNYALKAIKFSALDYVLKPIHVNDLIDATQKFFESKVDIKQNRVENFIKNLSVENSNKKIALSTINGFEFVEASQIIRIEAAGHYCKVYSLNNKIYTVTKDLKEFDELLISYGFFRVHHSHIINLSFISKYDKGRTGLITLKDNSCVPVSERKKSSFLEAINK